MTRYAACAVLSIVLPLCFPYSSSIADWTTAGIEATPHYYQLLVSCTGTYTRVYCCCVLNFLVSRSSLSVLSRSLLFFANTRTRYCRLESDIASEHITQHRAISSAQAALGVIQLLAAPNHGPLLSAVVLCCILPCASVAAGVSRPRSGALCTYHIVLVRTWGDGSVRCEVRCD